MDHNSFSAELASNSSLALAVEAGRGLALSWQVIWCFRCFYRETGGDCQQRQQRAMANDCISKYLLAHAISKGGCLHVSIGNGPSVFLCLLVLSHLTRTKVLNLNVNWRDCRGWMPLFQHCQGRMTWNAVQMNFCRTVTPFLY